MLHGPRRPRTAGVLAPCRRPGARHRITASSARPDGIYGLRADGALAADSSERHTEISEEHRRLNTVLNQVAQHSTQPPEEGQWDGGRIKDTYDDFAARYAFAFWRLAAQGVTVLGAPREPGESRPWNRPGAQPAEPDVRVIRLTNQVPAQRSTKDWLCW
ncbi:hypothetical protein ACWEP4_41120 [Streptomyces sp. NPDC004227]